MLRRTVPIHRTHLLPLIIIGKGAWGSALGETWKDGFAKVIYLDKDTPSSHWSEALRSKGVIVLACPYRAFASVIDRLKDFQGAAIINASKGIDPTTLTTFSSKLVKKLKAPCLTLSGPTFALEVLQKKPAAAVLASHHLGLAKKWAKQLSRPHFRLYASHDPVGVETCGALKNVLAIACGISDGLNLGLNARAALLTRGLRELQILTHFLGGRSETVFGLAGVGDLWLTATGDLSRNRQVGLALARGLTPSQAEKKIGSTCEGLFTVLQVAKIARKNKLDLPISNEVYRICTTRKAPKKSLLHLMTRALKSEETIVQKAHQRASATRQPLT